MQYSGVTLALDSKLMRSAFVRLDDAIDSPAHLVVGGGAAMSLAYDHPLATQDVDAFASKGSLTLAELDSIAKQIAQELDIARDWLNAHFQTFTFVLPDDYASRLRRVFAGKRLHVDALGPEDLLIMKCFAGRAKDLPHARALMKLNLRLDIVDARISDLLDKDYRGAERAADFFDDLRDELAK